MYAPTWPSDHYKTWNEGPKVCVQRSDKSLAQGWKINAGGGGGTKGNSTSKEDIWMVSKNFISFQLTTSMQWTDSQLYHTAKKYLVAGLIQTTSMSYFLLIEGVQNNLVSLLRASKRSRRKKKDIGSNGHLNFY